MATRRDIQAALDIIKYANIMNDFLDESSKFAKNEKQLKIPANPLTGTPAVERDFTFEEKKEKLQRMRDNLTNYHNTLNIYLSDNTKRTQAESGLQALGCSLTDIINDNTNYKIHADKIAYDANNAKSIQDIEAIADYIDSNIDKLNLLRNK